MASRRAMKAAIYTSQNSARMAALQRKTVQRKTQWKRVKRLPKVPAETLYGEDGDLLTETVSSVQTPSVKGRRAASINGNKGIMRKSRRLSGRQIGRFFPLFLVLLIILFVTAFALKG